MVRFGNPIGVISFMMGTFLFPPLVSDRSTDNKSADSDDADF